jgi:hypothetical protein
MEALLSALTKRQAMLLLTAVTYSGQDAALAFDHLSDDEAEVLKHRVKLLMQIAAADRVPLLVGEMRKLLSSKASHLWTVEPGALARVLKHERPALVDALLRALPSAVATPIRELLPSRSVMARKAIKPEVLNVVHMKLEELLRREAPKRRTFRFSDLRHLSVREVLTLTDRLGVRALGPVLAALDEAALDGFLGQLPPELRSLAAAAAKAAGARKLPPERAAAAIASHGEGLSAPELVRSAGAHKVVRAALAQSPEFCVDLLERNQGHLGAVFLRWFREEKGMTLQRGDGGRTEAVMELEALAEQGLVDPPLRPFVARRGTVSGGGPMSPHTDSSISLPRLPPLPGPPLPSPRDAMEARLQRGARAAQAPRRPPPPPPDATQGSGMSRSVSRARTDPSATTRMEGSIRKPGRGGKGGSR